MRQVARHRINFFAAVAILLTIISCSASKQTVREGITPKIQPAYAADAMADVKKTNFKPFHELIPEGTVANKGLFNLYKVGEKYYFEIPDSLLGREMMMVTRLVRTPAGVKVPQHAYGGEEENDQVWKWERHDKRIFIRVPNYSVRADSSSDMYHSMQNSNLDVILSAFDIKGYNRDSTGVMIDVSDFFNGDLPALGISNELKKNYRVAGMDFTKSYLESVKSFPLNIEARSVKTYRIPDVPSDHDNGLITFELNNSLVLLPKTPMKPRLLDGRVGYINQKQIDYGSDAQKADVTAYINRFRLEPKDSAAYIRGELVEPKKPIVFYIDPATPKKWVPYIIQGVNDWQKAFEAAGFKNAIMAREAPTPQEDPEFSTEDARYNVIRYFASDIENAYGPQIADPRSGEVIESHVCFYHNHLKLLHDWYMIQTAAVNPLARTMQLPDELLGNMIRFIITHEVGHTLGLKHNVVSSSAYPVDSLRSKSFTDQHGTAASIMDYARFNYIAQPGDGVTHFNPQIGEYDLWAIKWGYSWFSNHRSAAAEKEILDTWTSKKHGNPLYKWEAERSNQDPGAQYEDLGDNSVKASKYGIANLQRIIPNLEKWTYQKGKDYSDLKDLYGQAIGQFNRYIYHVITNIGGIYLTNNTTDEPGKAIVFVPANIQREAVLFLNQQLFKTPSWLFNIQEMDQFDNGEIVNRVKTMQVSAVEDVLFPPRLSRMYENELRNATSAYTVARLLTDLSAGIFNDGTPDVFKRNLQRGYIAYLKVLMIESYKSRVSASVDDLNSRGAQPIEVANSDIRALVRTELSAIATHLPVSKNPAALAHFNDLRLRIKDALLYKTNVNVTDLHTVN